MVHRLIGISLQLRYLVIVIAVAMLVFGATQLRGMPVDVYPEFDPPLVEIQTEALGLSAAEVESLITLPMEADLLNGVAWLDRLYSESVAGMSSILLVFEPGTDVIRARQMVQERLNQTYALPNVSQPPTMLQPLSSTGRVMMVGLSSDQLSLIQMGVLARWNIVPRLMGIPGVSNVAIWGQRERQLQVQVDPLRLRASGVTMQQVIETTGEALWVSPLSFLEASTPGTAGWIDTPNQRLSIRHTLPISSAEDLAKVPVDGGNGLLLGDVARVVEDHQPLIGDAILNSGPGMLLVIEKFPGADTLAVTRGVEDALNVLQPGLSGIKFDTSIYRPANYIEQATGNLSTATIIAAVLVFLVLALFFFGWRTALISLIAIPLSLAAAVYVLNLRGMTFNMMVLAGLVIALGIVIDDAVISVENINRHLRQQRNGAPNGPQESTAKIIQKALLEMYRPIGFAVLITLLSVTPVFVMEGLTGSFFQPFAVSYILAVLASMVVALTLTPALSMLLLSNVKFTGPESPLAAWLERGYQSLLSRTVHKSRLAYAVIAVIVVAGLIALPALRVSLLPSLKETDLLIQWEGTPGMSRSEMNRIITQASRELQTIPGVHNVGSHVGRAITGDAVVGINSGELWVSLDPAANHDATVSAIHEVVDGYPGVLREVQAYQPKRIGEALMGTSQDVVVRVYGHDQDILTSKAQEVSQMLSQVNGVIGARADLPAEEAQIEIEVDLAAAERFQIKPGDVRRAAALLLSGLRVGNLYEEQKVYDVMVWGVPELRSSLTAIRELPIDTPAGQVRLGDLADVRIVPTPIVIKRDSVSRYIDVTASVSGGNYSAVTADIQQQLRGIEFPLEFHAEVLGDALRQQAAQQRILIFGIAALFGIFLILQASFKSWRLAFVGFLTLPMGLAGGVLAALLGGTVTLGSLFGFLAILGIIVRNSILLMNRFQRLEQHEGYPLGPEVVLRGAGDRLKPILMTALSIAAAFLPIIAAGDIAGLEIVRPMAIVIVGGLVTTTLLSLFILPALYLQFGASREPDFDFEPVAVPSAD